MFLARYNKDRFNYIENKLKNKIKYLRIGNEKFRKLYLFTQKNSTSILIQAMVSMKMLELMSTVGEF